MKLLYTTDAMHAAILDVLTDEPGARRVAIVAYVGMAAASYIPSPEGLELICSLQPGATSAIALQELRRRGATIYKSRRLHAKVYWSSTKGCVVGSANLSQNSLGKGGLIECGVLLPPGVVDIKKLLLEAKPEQISPTDLKSLQAESDKLEDLTGPRGPRSKPREYSYWFDNEGRGDWKLGVWSEMGETSAASKQAAKQIFGSSTISGHLDVSSSGAKAHDWLLCFKLPMGTDVDWMRVNCVVPVPRNDKAFDPEFPFQAIQVFPNKFYPTPPFAIDAKFEKALKVSIKEFGAERLEIDNAKPPSKFLKLLRSNFK